MVTHHAQSSSLRSRCSPSPCHSRPGWPSASFKARASERCWFVSGPVLTALLTIAPDAGGKVFLTPLAGMLQMRPDMSYIDRAARQDAQRLGVSPGASSSASGPGTGGSGGASDAQRMRTQAGRRDDGLIGGRRVTAAQLRALLELETPATLAVRATDSAVHRLTRSQLTRVRAAPGDQPIDLSLATSSGGSRSSAARNRAEYFLTPSDYAERLAGRFRPDVEAAELRDLEREKGALPPGMARTPGGIATAAAAAAAGGADGGDSGDGVDGSHDGSGGSSGRAVNWEQASIARLATAPPHIQAREFLRRAMVIPHARAVRLMTSCKSTAAAAECLGEVGLMVRGCWVFQPDLLFARDRPDLRGLQSRTIDRLRHSAGLLQCKFTESAEVDRAALREEFPRLRHDVIRKLLDRMAVYDAARRVWRWRFEGHPDAVIREGELAEAATKQARGRLRLLQDMLSTLYGPVTQGRSESVREKKRTAAAAAATAKGPADEGRGPRGTPVLASARTSDHDSDAAAAAAAVDDDDDDDYDDVSMEASPVRPHPALPEDSRRGLASLTASVLRSSVIASADTVLAALQSSDLLATVRAQAARAVGASDSREGVTPAEAEVRASRADATLRTWVARALSEIADEVSGPFCPGLYLLRPHHKDVDDVAAAAAVRKLLQTQAKFRKASVMAVLQREEAPSHDRLTRLDAAVQRLLADVCRNLPGGYWECKLLPVTTKDI